MKNLSFRIFFLAVFLAATLYGCGPLTSTTVTLNREVYFSQIQPTEFASLKGKRILLGTITDQSSNTTNLNYFNPEKTVGYRLYYTSPQNSMAQPVVSFLWYTLKKGFEQAGVVVVEDGPLYDAEVYMTLQSVTDEEIRFNALVTMKGAELYKKDYAVRAAGEKTTDVAVLERRAYGMFDDIVRVVLKDAEKPLTGASDKTPTQTASAAVPPVAVGPTPSATPAAPAAAPQIPGKMTLPGGEIIWDLNGNYEAYVAFRGIWSNNRPHMGPVKIRQEGRVFEIISTEFGNTVIQGEIHQNGLKNCKAFTERGTLDMEGRVADNGQRVIFKYGALIDATYTKR